MRGAGGGEGAVWSNPGGSVRGNIAVPREGRREGGEEHRVVGGDVEEEKKRNLSTNEGTCTSVVHAHGGTDKKAEPRRTLSSSSTMRPAPTSKHSFNSLAIYSNSHTHGTHILKRAPGLGFLTRPLYYISAVGWGPGGDVPHSESLTVYHFS